MHDLQHDEASRGCGFVPVPQSGVVLFKAPENHFGESKAELRSFY